MIESVTSLEEILEPYAGQTVYSEADDKVFRFDPVAGWEEIKTNGNLSLSAYEINKQVISQLPPLSAEELAEKKILIRDFMINTQNKYFMLLCRDINYYTLFHLDVYENTDERLEDILFAECAMFIGDIKAVDPTDDGAIEIWVTNETDTYAMYFFPYDAGVILCV